MRSSSNDQFGSACIHPLQGHTGEGGLEKSDTPPSTDEAEPFATSSIRLDHRRSRNGGGSKDLEDQSIPARSELIRHEGVENDGRHRVVAEDVTQLAPDDHVSSPGKTFETHELPLSIGLHEGERDERLTILDRPHRVGESESGESERGFEVKGHETRLADGPTSS